MYYTVYRTTNKVNGKTYIGKHKTTDPYDDYLGSGKLLKRAIEKYGIQNFSKEVLFIFDNETDMNSKEKELVTISEDTYNLIEGGQGGFSYVNRNKLNKGKPNFLPGRTAWNKGKSSPFSADNARKGADKLRMKAIGRKRQYREDGSWTWYYPD
jgi:hypothetical protein